MLVAHGAPPAELMAALQRKQLDIREHRSVISAMAEIMAHTREIRAGRTRQPLVLLIVDRTAVSRADELVAACTIYAPHAVAWTYDRAATPALRSYHANGSANKPAPAAVATGTQPKPRIVISHTPPPSPQITIVRKAEPPRLRLTDQQEPPAPRPHAEEPDDQPPALSDDELRMLLSDDWDPTRGRERDDR